MITAYRPMTARASSCFSTSSWRQHQCPRLRGLQVPDIVVVQLFPRLLNAIALTGGSTSVAGQAISPPLPDPSCATDHARAGGSNRTASRVGLPATAAGPVVCIKVYAPAMRAATRITWKTDKCRMQCLPTDLRTTCAHIAVLRTGASYTLICRCDCRTTPAVVLDGR